ncbi:sulfatase-like hydrolase/transferase [Flammeovirgaceae bacterium SG7u.111]|nr:sulfatase-like hydrolase/transferase [Flammeovirgaceae bacterium SG7u.132]WPO35020.1 sulfatase-like hydrolase/transferase [Flammeovirgaceae bacterium SG7u.111]
MKLLRLLFFLTLITPLTLSAQSTDRPNVIFVMPDDISHNAFSYYKENGPQTPSIDGFAKDAVRLTDFHVSPSCSPTRAALLTGRPSDVVGVWHTINGRNMLRADEITMADIFKANGYATGLFFKWHLGDNYPFRPKDRGFEYVAWTKGGGTGQLPDYWGNTNQSASMWVNDSLVKMVDEDDGIEGAFTTNFFISCAMDFMDENIQKNKPFFAYIPLATAHAPHVMPPDARSGVSAKTGTIENIDKNFGRLLKFLDDKGIADNTILIFTTDNGAGGPLRGGKGSNYDGGTRVPCFIRWANGNLGGDGKGGDVLPLTAHIDWLPTFMDMLGLEDVENRPEKLKIRGRSFKPFLDDDPSNDPIDYKNRAVTINDMWTEFPEKYKKLSVKKDSWDGDVIKHKWRLTRTSSDSDWELYDVLVDEAQKNDIIGDPVHKAVVAELKEEYEAWWKLVDERSSEYTRIILDNSEEPESHLLAHDFHGTVIWSQDDVKKGAKGSGFIAVELDKPGTYHFDLRRWPKEIEGETTLTSAGSGKALDIASARIKIWNGDKVYADEKKEADPNADGVNFSIKDLPKGPAFIQTWFYNAAGEMEGAVYYNYASHSSYDMKTGAGAMNDNKKLKKSLLYQDEFNTSLENWTTEIETTASISLVDGKLDINTEMGSTVWFNQKLEQPVVITYEVTTYDDGIDGLPRDHNLFWMAHNPELPNEQPTGEGSLGDYSKYNMYYAGIGGNKNRTTRFRRYFNSERTLVHESNDKTHLNGPNQTYKMKIVCVDNQISVYRDGRIYWDFYDQNPYTEGWFGFRQARTHLQIDNFKVYSVALDH